MIEPKDSDSPIITQSAKDIVQSGEYNHIPLIVGYNADEALIINANQLSNFMKDCKFENFLPFHMSIDKKSELAIELGEKIKQEYMKNETEITGYQRVSSYLVWEISIVYGNNASERTNMLNYFQMSKLLLGFRLEIHETIVLYFSVAPKKNYQIMSIRWLAIHQNLQLTGEYDYYEWNLRKI